MENKDPKKDEDEKKIPALDSEVGDCCCCQSEEECSMEG
jgi:hypothetical protein